MDVETYVGNKCCSQTLYQSAEAVSRAEAGLRIRKSIIHIFT